MISASTAFTGEIEKSSRFFKVKLYNDNLDVSGSIRSVSVHLGSCGDQAFQIGAVFTSYIEVILDEMVTRLQGLELRLDVGVLVGETYDYITLGYFTCLTPETSEYQTSFTAQGRIGAKFDNEFTPPEVQSLSGIAASLSAQTGVTVSFASGIVTNGVITRRLSGLTCREVLEVLAGVVGGYATETSAGIVMIRRYSSAVSKIVTGDIMRDLPTTADYDFTVNGIRVSVSAETTDDEGTTVPEVFYETGDVNVTLTDEYMTETLFEQMSSGLLGLSYRPATVTMALGDPRLEPQDALQIGISGGTAIVPCMSIEHNYDGGWQTRVIAPGPEETGFILGATGKVVQQLVIDMLQVKRLFAKYARIDMLNVDRIESRDGATYWDLTTNELCLGGYLLRASPEYALGLSAVVPPAQGWSETAPAREQGKYLWQRIALHQGSGDTSYTEAVCIQGADGKGIASASIEYAQSQSGTSPPESGWGSNIPSVSGGDYLWSRTTIIYTDGNRTQTYTVSRQGEKGDTGDDGEDAVLLRLSSSNGTAFRNNTGSTALSVVIYHGQNRIVSRSQLTDEFGSGAQIQWEWIRPGESAYRVIASSDSRISENGFRLTLSPSDIEENATFRCSLLIGNSSRAADQISIVDLTDGYSVMLTNDSFTFAGSVSAAIAGNTQTTVIAMCGGTQVAAAVNNSAIAAPTGVTTSVDTDPMQPTITISVANTVTQGGTVDIPVSLDGGNIVIHKKFTFQIAFSGASGTSAEWYSGNKITGTSTSDTAFPSSGITAAKVGDMYLNTETMNTYRCTAAGTPQAARWIYTGNIRGAAGEDAITLSISSSNGFIFKNAAVVTTLTAHVYRAGTELTEAQIAELGTIRWYRDGSVTPVATGPVLNIAAGSVTDKANYTAQLEE